MGRNISFDKDEILQICMQLFWQKGYTDTSMRELQAATRLSGRSLIHSFGDKRAIFEKCLQAYLHKVAQTIEQCQSAAKPLDHYFALFDQAQKNDPRHFGCFILNCAHGDLLTDADFVRSHQNFKQQVYDFFYTEVKKVSRRQIEKRSQCLVGLFINGLVDVAFEQNAQAMNKQAELIKMLMSQWAEASTV